MYIKISISLVQGMETVSNKKIVLTYIKEGWDNGSILRQLILEIIRLQNSTW